MALTANSELYGAVHDEGVNRVIRHVMRQRPSLFNYGTALVKADPRLLCARIDAAPSVTELMTVLPPIPLLPAGLDLTALSDLGISLSGAANLALDFAFQLTDLEIDFHPGDVITLPPELSPPHQAQHFSFRAKVCGGLSCIPEEILKRIPIPRNPRFPGMVRPAGRERRHLESRNVDWHRRRTDSELSTASLLAEYLPRLRQPRPPFFPVNRLECFCIELFGTGSGDFEGEVGNQRMLLTVDRFELKDIEPKGLENSIECYMHILATRVILPEVSNLISELAFHVQPLPDASGILGSIQLSASTSVPNNPALEDNQLKLFLNLRQLTLIIPPIVIEEDGGAPTPTRITRSRTRTGPAHLTGAVSEAAFREVFEVIRNSGIFRIQVEPQSLPLLGVTGSAEADIEFHLTGGTVEFQSDGTIRISELDIKWDKLDVTIGINLPRLCFQACYPLLWPPWYDCVELGCLFERNPDISFTLHLPTGFTTEVSLNAGLKTYYGLGAPNEWLVYITPSKVDVDVIDIADTVGDILESALNSAAAALGLPSWAGGIISSITDLVRSLLDLPDDLGEWLQGLIFDTLGIRTTIADYLSVWLADSMPIFRLEDPAVLFEAEGSLVPVGIPIEYIEAKVSDTEITIIGDVEA